MTTSDTSVCGVARVDGNFCPAPEHPDKVHTLEDGTEFRTDPLVPDGMLTAALLKLAERRNRELEAELAKASYVRGDAQCIGDPEDPADRWCPEYTDNPDLAWCSHVEHHIATLADVRHWEVLEELVDQIKRAAENAHAYQGGVSEFPDHVLDMVESHRAVLREQLKDIGGLKALAPNDARAVLADIEATFERWRNDPVQEQIRPALDRADRAEDEADELRGRLREVTAERDKLAAAVAWQTGNGAAVASTEGGGDRG